MILYIFDRCCHFLIFIKHSSIRQVEHLKDWGKRKSISLTKSKLSGK